MRYWKGLLFMVIVCLSQVLLTYLSMTLIPKIKSKSKNPNYYRAAVYEIAPFMNDSLSIKEVLYENVKNFQKAAQFAASQEVDILVFPERVLFEKIDDYKSDRKALIGSFAENIPNPNEGDYNPCEQEKLFADRPLLRNLSCMAKSNKMFIVVNIVDYKHCDNATGSKDKNSTLNCSDKNECPDDGLYLYNTNVVFNRAGKLVVRYHKKHLYLESTVNPSKCYHKGYFETDFGAFVTTIGVDIMFKDFEDILQQTKIIHVAYSTHWYDQMPLFTFGSIYYQAFSITNKIYILASNANIPGTGTAGSGIFSGSDGAFLYTHQPDSINKLLISSVPKQLKTNINFDTLHRKKFVQKDDQNFVEVDLKDDFMFSNECEIESIGQAKNILKDFRCRTSNLSSFKLKKLTSSADNIKLCDQSFCCALSYEARSLDEDYFLAVSASGYHMKKMHDYKLRLCFVTRCKSKDGKDCSSFYLNSKTVFKTAELKGEIINKYVYPFVVDSSLTLTSKDQWTFDGNSQILYQNLDTNSSLLFLGLYGTDFENWIRF